MNVLHICSYYYGSPLYSHLIGQLEKQGIGNTAYCPVSSPHPLHGESFAVDMPVCFSEPERLVFRIKSRKIARDLHARYDFSTFSLIHAHSLFVNGWQAMQLRRMYGIPYIVAVRNTDVNVFFQYMLHLRGLGVQILKEAEQVIFLSPAYKNHVIDRYLPTTLRNEVRAKSLVIPNGIDPFWHENTPTPRIAPKNGCLRIIAAGDIDRNKNSLATANACALLRKEGLSPSFTVVGSIKDNQVARKLQAYPFVELIERQPKEKLIELYRQSDLFVMPSLHETFGLVYAEAMSQGLPVLYTKGQGFDGQFPEGQIGFCVNPRNPAQIADRVKAAVGAYPALSSHCTQAAGAFTWPAIAAQYEMVYRKMAGQS